ncbi:MAG: 30S ribosomal protein S17 [Desulfuromonadaceae bacterium]|nr:30S ribosomal protein S17 [Desulfuromonadaceae bacterium]
MAQERGNRKTQVGIVVSDKMDKTVVVNVDQLAKHPIYKKYIKRRTKYKAHDELNNCGIGDKVLIVECRPLSRDKRWRVREILEKNVIV